MHFKMKTGSVGIQNPLPNKYKTTLSPFPEIVNVEPVASIFNFKTILRPTILGSIDGLITSFVIIAGGIAGNVSKNSVIVIGFSSLVADAFSMGTSEYLSSRTQTSIRNSVILGFSCFSSFILFGIVPLLGYSLANRFEFVFSAVFFIVCLIVVSLLRNCYTSTHVIYSIIETIVLGSFAGGIAYGVAYLSHSLQKAE